MARAHCGRRTTQSASTGCGSRKCAPVADAAADAFYRCAVFVEGIMAHAPWAILTHLFTHVSRPSIFLLLDAQGVGVSVAALLRRPLAHV